MGLNLSVTYSQSNDATYLTITDTTGDYSASNLEGWGTPNEEYTDVVASTTLGSGKYHLKLTVIVLDKEGDTTTYDDINLYDLDSTGPFATTADLTWSLHADDLISGGTAMGTEEDRLADGIYTITYSLYPAAASGAVLVDEDITEMLVDGDVRNDVYDALREVSRQYDNEVNDESDEINEALLKYVYLKAINASATVSETDNIINMLWTLNKLNSDGSKYSW